MTIYLRNRDSQRQKVYRWERAQWWWATGFQMATTRRGSSATTTICSATGDQSMALTLDQCRALTAKLWNQYPHRTNFQSPPNVMDGRGCRNARGGIGRIVLPVWARTVPIVCHEVAHSIVMSNQYGSRETGMYQIDPGHGPLFVGVYAQLLELAGVTSAASVRRTAVDSGIAVIDNPNLS